MSKFSNPNVGPKNKHCTYQNWELYQNLKFRTVSGILSKSVKLLVLSHHYILYHPCIVTKTLSVCSMLYKGLEPPQIFVSTRDHRINPTQKQNVDSMLLISHLSFLYHSHWQPQLKRSSFYKYLFTNCAFPISDSNL